MFAEHYTYRVMGRPRMHLEFILRCHLVGLFYNLSGEGLTDALNDSEAFKRFIRLGLLEAEVPEESTLRNLRYLIEEKDLADKILQVVNESLGAKGLKMSHGTLVDATIITASSSTKNKDKQRDPQMGSTKKNNNWHHGLKIHVGEDAEANVVHHVEVTAASESDVGQSAKLLRETDQAGLGDKGYQGAATGKVELYTPFKRGSLPESLEGLRKAYNRQVASLRSKVEHGFRIIKCVFGWRKARYRGLKKNRTAFVTLVALANLYRNRKLFQSAMA